MCGEGDADGISLVLWDYILARPVCYVSFNVIPNDSANRAMLALCFANKLEDVTDSVSSGFISSSLTTPSSDFRSVSIPVSFSGGGFKS